MFVLEALRAKHGDALILHFGTKRNPQLAVIDGGPPGVYGDALKPRLEQIRAERKLAANEPLDIALAMVSHIDADHIAGLLELTRELRDLRDARQSLPYRIRRFWHNSFDDILGTKDSSLSAVAGAISAASLNGSLSADASLLLASVGQGRELRKVLDGLRLADNAPFGGLVVQSSAAARIEGLTLTIIAPSKSRLDALQKDWDEKIKRLLAKEKAARAEIAAYLDKSVYNLSSIVVLAEFRGRTILLTGDGRGDHTLEGLAATRLLDAHGKLRVDILKLPHHGSIRNVKKAYFETILADHYVISADGKFDNPDVATLEAIAGARKTDDFTIHLTYPPADFAKPEIGAAVQKFLDRERTRGRRYNLNAGSPDERSVRIALQ